MFYLFHCLESSFVPNICISMTSALPESTVLLHGVWVDQWNILVVSDSLNTLHFLKSNEEELMNALQVEMDNDYPAHLVNNRIED